ncbi:MAG: hypothetical protein PVF58_09930 [Candidatus Methanofastidiosia archaeon]|jgi:hypothetical protein
MILNALTILQDTVFDIFKNLFIDVKNIIIQYLVYILAVIALILLYLVLTRVVFRGSVYRTERKGAICTLTMAGEERSLEYLERFEGMKGIDIQVIEYLRKNQSIPQRKLEKTFGSAPVKRLIEMGLIKVT